MPDDEPGQPGVPIEWALDAAIGAASSASRAAAAVTRSMPGRAAAAAARFITSPLSEEGREVRERAAPAAREAVKQITPEVVQVVDLDEILASVDINALLDRIDVNRLVERIDVGAIVSQVDVQELVSGVDVQAIVDRVDVDGLIAEYEFVLHVGRQPDLEPCYAAWQERLTSVMLAYARLAGSPSPEVDVQLVLATLRGLEIAALAAPSAEPDREALTVLFTRLLTGLGF